MKKGLIAVLALSLVVFFSGNSFAGWEVGAKVEQIKKTAAGTYVRVELASGAKILALCAPTLENHLLAVLLTAQAATLTVDVNLAPGPKIIGAASNTTAP